MDDSLTDQISRLLKDKDTPQDVVNEVLASMAIVQSKDMDTLIESVGEQGEKIDTMARSLDTLALEVRAISAGRRRLLEVSETVRRYPSITWLLNHKTRQTITVIVVVFVILSLWFVSGFRAPLLTYLGLPVF